MLNNKKRLKCRGAAGVEYGLIVGLIGVAIIGTVKTTGAQISALMCSVANALSSETTCDPQTVSHGETSTPQPDPCASATTPGTMCDDESWYIGDINGKKIYIADASTNVSLAWGPGGDNYLDNVNSSDGKQNTSVLMTKIAGRAGNDGRNPSEYPAAYYCAYSFGTTKYPQGTEPASADGRGLGQWYLPSGAELALAYQNCPNNGTASKCGQTITVAQRYWSSAVGSVEPWKNACAYNMNTGICDAIFRTGTARVVCARQSGS